MATTYIDPISSTLANFNDSMRNYGKTMKDYADAKLALADLMNRTGHDNAFSAYGEDKRDVTGMYANQIPAQKALQSLLAPTAANNIDTHNVLNVAKDYGIADKLNNIYKDNPEALKAQLQLMGLQSGNQDMTGTNQEGMESGNALDVLKSEKQVAQQNARIAAENTAADNFNRNIPQYHTSYTGNRSDKLQQLDEDFKLKSKYGLSPVDVQMYSTMRDAINKDHQGNSKDLDPRDFAMPGKGGKSDKVDHYIVTATDGKDYTVQIPKGQVFAKNLSTVNSQLKSIAGDGVTFKTGTNPQPKGEVSGDTEAISLKKEEDKRNIADRDRAEYQEAAKIRNSYYSLGGLVRNKGEVDSAANNELIQKGSRVRFKDGQPYLIKDSSTEASSWLGNN